MEHRIDSRTIPRPGAGRAGPVCLLTALAIFFTIFTPGRSSASARCPFDTLEIYAGVIANTNENEYHNFWEQGKGLEAYALTNFYAGDIELGLRYVTHSGKTLETPDYGTTTIYMGWSYPFRVAPWLVFNPGASAANNLMYFDTGEQISVDFETEISAALFARVGIRLHGRWRANITGRWMTMFTNRRIEMVYVSAGISRQLSMPGWLRGFLE